jgi:acetate---CoA ligase (ADP-forming)
VGQSGGIAMAIKRTLEERGVVSGSVVTSGNETGLTTADYIAYWAGDPGIKVIVAYLESVHDTTAFLAACRLAREAGKPVVAIKLGASDAGRAAALAHTGRLAGSMAAFDAVAGAAGVVRAANLDAVVEAVEYFVHAALPKGPGLGAITFSGGLRGLLLDAAAKQGMKFSELAPQTRRKLEALLTVGTIIGNPLDAGFAALTSQDAYLKCVEILLDDPGIDILLLQEELPRGPGTERKESNLRAVQLIAAHARKPIAFVTMISHGLTDYSRALREGLPHLPFLQEVDKAMEAVKSVTSYSVTRIFPPPFTGEVPPKAAEGARARSKAKLDRILSAATGCKTLNEVESKALLKAYGIAAPKEQMARNEREAVAAAKKIGFPVVAKAAGASLAHKSDIGGVVLSLNTAKDVRAAYKRLTGVVAKRAKVTLDGVLIAQQATGGLELVLGATRDPEMGWVVMVGKGGVDLELSPDVALAPLPLDARAAEALIGKTRVAKLIDGYRGAPPYDSHALVKALLALSQLAADTGEHLVSIDVNPFLLKRKGGLALDALVVLGGS